MLYEFEMMKTTDPTAFGKVAVLMGGMSSEREISLKSGKAVFDALQSQGVDVQAIDAGCDVLTELTVGAFNRVFIVLHGVGGEDGKLQGALETLGLPYTGSGVLGSALGMDKVRAKQLWVGIGLPTPRYIVYSKNIKVDEIVERIGLPVIVKPVNQGSSVGMAKVTEVDGLALALENAAKFDDDVMVEQWIQGVEYTVGILGDQALPLIKLETPHAFYDYDAKYYANDTRYSCPCGLDEKTELVYQKLALAAFHALDCHGWGRVDLMVDKIGNPWLLEVNTVPGMTDHSLVPIAAKVAGLSFEDLVWRILETTIVSGDG